MESCQNALRSPSRQAARVMVLAALITLAPTIVRAQECVWEQVATSGPGSRFGHAMAYDSRRAVTVLFGDASSSSADTWEWDGGDWRQVALTGPTYRSEHAMAFDSARGVVVLFGGRDNERRGDTWEWDGFSWSQVATTGPPPREGHARLTTAPGESPSCSGEAAREGALATHGRGMVSRGIRFLQ